MPKGRSPARAPRAWISSLPATGTCLVLLPKVKIGLDRSRDADPVLGGTSRKPAVSRRHRTTSAIRQQPVPARRRRSMTPTSPAPRRRPRFPVLPKDRESPPSCPLKSWESSPWEPICKTSLRVALSGGNALRMACTEMRDDLFQMRAGDICVLQVEQVDHVQHRHHAMEDACG